MRHTEDGYENSLMPARVKVVLAITAIFVLGVLFYLPQQSPKVMKDPVSVENKAPVVDARFGLALCEFDLTVPASFTHETEIDEFASRTKPLETTCFFNNSLIDANFASATNKLITGKTYKVRIFPVLNPVSSEECLAFLKKQKAILVGAQGLALVSRLEKDELPKGKATISFDEKEALPEIDGCHRVPCVDAYTGGDFDWNLGCFERVWYGNDCLLCFCDLS